MSAVLVVEPTSDQPLDMLPIDNGTPLPAPKCTEHGHAMLESDRKAGDYKHGWICRRCDDWFAPGESKRWHCAACCEDLCFRCWPNQRPVAASIVAGTMTSTVASHNAPLKPVCLSCGGCDLRHMAVAGGAYVDCDMCYRELPSGADVWWCSECEWAICSAGCATAAADVHLAAEQWREQMEVRPIRTWVAACGQPAFVSMPARELRALLFDKSKSRRRITVSVYNYASTKWELQRTQVKDVYIENKKQRAERKRLALSKYHAVTRTSKRKRTRRRFNSVKVCCSYGFSCV